MQDKRASGKPDVIPVLKAPAVGGGGEPENLLKHGFPTKNFGNDRKDVRGFIRDKDI